MKKILILTALGLILGYVYYSNFGCDSGCTLQSSPYIMSAYGGLIGLTLAMPLKKKDKEPK